MISSWHEKRASREEGLPLRFSGKGSGKMDMWKERKADVGLWGGGGVLRQRQEMERVTFVQNSVLKRIVPGNI